MNTTRLFLPDGGSFDLPLPGTGGKLTETRGAVLPSEQCSALVPVLLGALLGGIVTWVFVKLVR
jgi:hypothetical protein